MLDYIKKVTTAAFAAFICVSAPAFAQEEAREEGFELPVIQSGYAGFDSCSNGEPKLLTPESIEWELFGASITCQFVLLGEDELDVETLIANRAAEYQHGAIVCSGFEMPELIKHADETVAGAAYTLTCNLSFPDTDDPGMNEAVVAKFIEHMVMHEYGAPA